ncbi:hypothetical protein ACJRO7_015400 [Eucalyptus globulus]|uniref:Pentatricopeptide repeat-containing protein n=1 Tax=Eucalyptus globulus TaxID=34317 RepID=A0ABD3L979_EUCGL
MVSLHFLRPWRLSQTLSATSPAYSLFHSAGNCPSPQPGSSSSFQPHSVVASICLMVCDAYYKHAHVRVSPLRLCLNVNCETLTHEQAITVVASLANEAGSMVALSFFYWAIGYDKFWHFMWLYIVCAASLIGNGKSERANEVMQCMVKSFAEIGRLKEAIDMALEMQNQGLVPTTRLMNFVMEVAIGSGFLDYAGNVFDYLSERGVCPDPNSYKPMVVAYYRMGSILEADASLSKLIDRDFVIDNATLTLITSSFCEKGFTTRAIWYFWKMADMGLTPNVLNYTSLINGLMKKGSIKQGFELLEEMKGWSDKAFRLFLKLVWSENYKPNVLTYTAMIGGYCRENKMNRAEMLFSRMQDQGLIPTTNTYTTLIDGHCKGGNFERAYELMGIMTDAGFSPNMCTYNALIDGLCKRGRFEETCKMLKKCFQTINFFYRMSDHGCLPDSITYCALISGLCKESRLKEACRLYDSMIDKGLSPCEVTQMTLAYEYCKKDESANALLILERLEDKLWIQTVNTLVRKLCSEKKKVDRVTLAAFMTACYESNKYALLSDLTKRIREGNAATPNLVDGST